MLGEREFSVEPVIGHYVEAERSDNLVDLGLQDVADDLGIDVGESDDFVTIYEGDVDWDESRSLRLRESVLRDIALEFTDLVEPDGDE